MTAHTSADQEARPSTSSSDSTTNDNPASPQLSDFEHISYPSTSSSQHSSSSMSASAFRPKARLIYCKSRVSIHPTQFNKDNVSGYLGIVEAEGNAVTTDDEGKVGTQGKELLVVWVPDEVLQRMDEEDRKGYRTIEARTNTVEAEEDGFVFVSVPPPKGENYAFSVPLSGIYSMLVYPPSLQHWYGSATFNLTGGISLPTLFFHDDESPLLTSPPQSSPNGPRAQWGFPPFLSVLQTRATTLRSRLISGSANHNAELWLVNPSKADREVHEAGIEVERKPKNPPPRKHSTGYAAYPPKGQYPDLQLLHMQDSPKQALLSGLSSVTSFSRRLSQQILASPLAQEVVPHLPPAVRSLVNAPGEWERSGRLPAKKGNGDVASEFESARLYLARWARVVAEEGERARRNEVAGKAGVGEQNSADDLTSSLGVFSLLSSPNSKRPIPHPTRTPQTPITSRDWASFAAQGRDEFYVRREIFKRGFSDSSEPEEKRTRRQGWEILLGVVPWSVGGLGGGEAGKAKRGEEREGLREEKRKEYERLRERWKGNDELRRGENWKEEWHRIDVDCRRTDRTQTIFAIPNEAIQKGDAEKEAGGPGYDLESPEGEEGGSNRLNAHIAALRTILMTYHTYSPELGYVQDMQGMSDLLSPIYVVFEANEADAFWGLVGVMKMMSQNFSREQTGMRRQLSTLQQLIGVMDPELYAHLERTDSLNLFFCFRWILISFKREFKFEDVIRLWEILWTNVYSDQFVLFIALAILQSHRDVLIRYLTEFDEVLKYANDLSGTIDLDTTLAQAEVLFLQFKGLIEELDVEQKDSKTNGDGLRNRRGSVAEIKREADKAAVKKVASEQLRELLKGFEMPREDA